MVIIKLACEFCGKEYFDEVADEEIAKYESGKYHVQDCFPRMRSEYREMLISGMCPVCWDKTFSFEDEEEEDILECELESVGENWW